METQTWSEVRESADTLDATVIIMSSDSACGRECLKLEITAVWLV